MRTFASVLILAGSAFALLAGWGQVRMHDLFVRMHVATKPPTLGLALVLTGAAIRADGLAPTTKLLLAIVLQFLTAPVAAHLVGRAAHRVGDGDGGLAVDDLARDQAED